MSVSAKTMRLFLLARAPPRRLQRQHWYSSNHTRIGRGREPAPARTIGSHRSISSTARVARGETKENNVDTNANANANTTKTNTNTETTHPQTASKDASANEHPESLGPNELQMQKQEQQVGDGDSDESHLNWKDRKKAPKWMRRIAPSKGGKWPPSPQEAVILLSGLSVFVWSWTA
mmetsp:Transcript_2033/g.5410  ORF Transcript_2033/g.5410 Transcript_2033/m.5410 type:complete len:177 (+) Transcript_2033:177-707(+)